MKKILIVEDDILAAELERDYLEASDYEVELCGDGDEGYKKAESGIYDLLLLDIMLPGMSGFEICRRIRRKQNVPIIMESAYPHSRNSSGWSCCRGTGDPIQGSCDLSSLSQSHCKGRRGESQEPGV